MTKADLITDLKNLLVEECDAEFEAADIGDDMQLFGGGLDLDSLDALQMSLAIKEKYGVRIEGGPDGRKAFANMNSLADFIMAGQPAS